MATAMEIAHKKEQECKQNRKGKCRKCDENCCCWARGKRQEAKAKHSPDGIQI